MATAAEIAEFDTEELERQLGETRRELFNLRFQLATGSWTTSPGSATCARTWPG